MPDSDNDVCRFTDKCPSTNIGDIVNSEGCATSQLDTDGDGVTDDKDQCPDTPIDIEVNGEGCSFLYISENGITIKARNNTPIGYSQDINDIKYTVVDEEKLRQLVSDNVSVSNVVTSYVSNMDNLFEGKTTFNDDISSWDVSNVTSMTAILVGY